MICINREDKERKRRKRRKRFWQERDIERNGSSHGVCAQPLRAWINIVNDTCISNGGKEKDKPDLGLEACCSDNVHWLDFFGGGSSCFCPVSSFFKYRNGGSATRSWREVSHGVTTNWLISLSLFNQRRPAKHRSTDFPPTYSQVSLSSYTNIRFTSCISDDFIFVFSFSLSFFLIALK